MSFAYKWTLLPMNVFVVQGKWHFGHYKWVFPLPNEKQNEPNLALTHWKHILQQ